jgi:hypothetical protein
MKLTPYILKAKKKIALTLSFLSLLFVFNHCGNPFGTAQGELEFESYELPPNEQPTGSGFTQDMALSLTAFENSVYVLTRQYCINCHGQNQAPLHAVADVQTAHDAVLNGFKVDFNNIPNSRMVLKLRDSLHNCWSGDCNADADAMQNAIQQWYNQSFVATTTTTSTTSGGGGGGGTTTTVEVFDLENSTIAFGQSVHPITMQYCAGCHVSGGVNPPHGDANLQVAHDAVYNQNKVDFVNTANSRMVLKLSQSLHNCWSGDCNADAATMLAAIDQWKAGAFTTETIVVGGGGTGVNGNGSEIDVGTSTTLASEYGNVQNTDITIDMYAAVLNAPMAQGVHNATGLTYIEVPNGNGGLLQNNNAAAGWATINFQVPVAGAYKLWGLVNAPNGSDNSFHVKIDNGNYVEWKIETLSGTNSFDWREVRSNNENNEEVFNLSAGAHMLEVRQREDGTKISLMAVTQDPNFSGFGIYGTPRVTYSFDIESIVGVPATFHIDVQEYDMYSYKFSRPRIVSNSNIAARNLKVYVNGSFNPQHSTYTVIDKVAVPDDPMLSPYSMIVLMSNGPAQDTFGFTFEVLQVVN